MALPELHPVNEVACLGILALIGASPEAALRARPFRGRSSRSAASSKA